MLTSIHEFSTLLTTGCLLGIENVRRISFRVWETPEWRRRLSPSRTIRSVTVLLEGCRIRNLVLSDKLAVGKLQISLKISLLSSLIPTAWEALWFLCRGYKYGLGHWYMAQECDFSSLLRNTGFNLLQFFTCRNFRQRETVL